MESNHEPTRPHSGAPDEPVDPGLGSSATGEGYPGSTASAAKMQQGVGADPGDSPSASGYTLDQFAEDTQLSGRWLRGLGITQITYMSRPAVMVPYADENGKRIGSQFIVGPHGDDDGEIELKWKKGMKPTLAGLQSVPEARRLGYIFLCSSLIDMLTARSYHIPALALTAGCTWKEEYTGLLEGISTVYVPLASGRTIPDFLKVSRLKDRVKIAYLALGVKEGPA